MPSYKIHSLKDSHKLSFIIEGENENVLKQKLSSEGQIVLSVEPVIIQDENIFVFEGKKSDQSFIEGKIESENLFQAYDTLTKEYKYTITSLYPKTITDKSQQDKIFAELQSTFEEKSMLPVAEKLDTTNKKLQRNKEIIEKLQLVLQSHSEIEKKDEIIAEIKKSLLLGNSVITKDTLTTIVKDLLEKYRESPQILQELEGVGKDLGIMIMPKVVSKLKDSLVSFTSFLSPLVEKEKTIKDTATKTFISSDGVDHVTFQSIQDNKNIDTLLQNKYSKNPGITIRSTKENIAHRYTLLRTHKTIFTIGKVGFSVQKIFQMLLVTVLILLFIQFLLQGENSLFVTTSTLILLFFTSFLALVIPAETV